MTSASDAGGESLRKYGSSASASATNGMCDGLYERFIAIMRMEDGAVKSLGTFPVPEAYRGAYWRCDLHGRFNASGSLYGFNSVHEGSRQVYVSRVCR